LYRLFDEQFAGQVAGNEVDRMADPG